MRQGTSRSTCAASASSTASACGVLLEQHERSAQQGFRIDFVQGPPAVRRVFELTGMLDRLYFIEVASRRLASTA